MALDAGDARAGTGMSGLMAEKLKKIALKFNVKKGYHILDAFSQAIVEEVNPELGGAPGPHAASHQNGGGDEINVGGLSGTLADPQTAAAHAAAHQNGGGDEMSVTGLSGLLADDQNPIAHAAAHENGGGDEISVIGLSGLLADNQNPVPTAGADLTAVHDNVAGEIAAVTAKGTPTTSDLLLIEDAAAANVKKSITIGNLPAATPAAHAASHQNGGGDEISVAGLSGVLADNQPAIPAAGIDTSAIHDNVAAEISAIAAKAAPDTGDLLVIEDSTAGNAKKSITIGSLPAAAPAAHASTHENGGGDEINVGGLSGQLADNQPAIPADGIDTSAIHDNVAAEISAIAAKAIPSTSDLLVIEDAGAANAKKSITIGNLPAAAPASHAASHENGGVDEIDVGGLSGQLADDQNPTAHALDHQNGGGDQISVVGLSGLLADDQNPTFHASDHQNGGVDEISVAGLSGVLADNQPAIPADGIDTSAVHDNVAGEIAAVAAKAIPSTSDLLLIEDAASANAKKSVTIGNLPAATPASHAASHQNGGGDEISVTGLSGLLADDQDPTAHASDHENGGVDEMSVAGLNGLLADNQNPVPTAGADTTAIHDNVSGEISVIAAKAIPSTSDLLVIEDAAAGNAKKSITIGNLPAAAPASHATSHQNGGGDEISVAGLSGQLADNQPAIPAAGIDTTAIHDNVDGEIVAVALKAVPVTGDLLLIENAGAPNAKQRITIGSLPAAAPASHAASHENGGGDEISVTGLSGLLADNQNPVPTAGADTTAIHDNVSGEIAAITDKPIATTSDLLVIEDAAAGNAKKRISIGNLPAASPASHASSHENGGGDEISVAGLSGVLADNQHQLFTSAKTSNYTAASKEFVRYDISGPTFILKMPSAPSTDDRVGIKNVTTDISAITLDGNGNNVEDPSSPGSVAASVSVAGAGISLIYQYDGAGKWWIV